MRPTAEQIKNARNWFTSAKLRSIEVDHDLDETANAIRILLAATEPPTDEEIAARISFENIQHHDKTEAFLTLKAMREPRSQESRIRNIVRYFVGAPEPK